jgi:murein DD-endopeptidase MepM/ murein hydrolase activator NlpD
MRRMLRKAPESWARVVPAESSTPGNIIWNAILTSLGQRGPDGTTSIVRVASHLVIVAVAILVLWFSHLHLPAWDIDQAQVVDGYTTQVAPGQVVQTDTNAALPNNLIRAPVPLTLITTRPRTDLLEHTVAAGDTLYDIAAKYHISADTLVWANNLEENPDLLRLGQQLLILPTNGVLHVVKDGDTLDSIAKKYSAKVADITGFEWNQLDAQNPAIKAGQKLIVPNGIKEMPAAKPAAVPMPAAQVAKAPANAPRGVGRFIWPTAGTITQGYGRYHTAIDIASHIGAPVSAGDAGYIAVAGWSNVGYGYHIIIDHGNGYQTLYAHLSKINVQAGQTVAKGQNIGLVGSTGNSTGPHLHFEVRLSGVGQNPFNFLP